jgi:myosin heavy subunit
MSRYDSAVMLVCYENEEEAAAAAAAAAAAEAAAAEAAAVEAAKKAAESGKTFTQAQVNAFLADDRRKSEAKLEAKWRADKKSALEAKAEEYRQLSQRASLTEQERDEYRAKAESADKAMEEFMTEKERLLKEKSATEATYKAKLTAAEKAQKEWQDKYVNSSIQRELQEAAVKHEAYNVQQMMNALRPYTKVVDDKVMVDLADVVDGKPVTTTLAPDAALKRMKELPDLYGNMFKANVVSGAGANNAGSPGKVDPKHMTQEQYVEYRKKLLK